MKLKRAHIQEEWSEGEDGYWIALKSGWKSDLDPIGAVHCIHENTRKEAYQCGVMRCQCQDCSKQKP